METPDKQVEVILEKDAVTTHVSGAGHAWIVDEPTEYGGGNQGPDPYSYLLGALGACTAITLRLYAQRKGWPLARVVVTLSHRKNYIDDCRQCEEDGAKLDYVEKKLLLEGDLSADQLKRLHVIADKCPLHKTLAAGITVQSTLVLAP